MATVEEDGIKQLETSARFMKRKMTQARKLIGDTGVAIPYDNGGGQTGIRENPALSAYLKLNSEYKATLKAIADMKERQEASRKAEPQSSLSQLRVHVNRSA